MRPISLLFMPLFLCCLSNQISAESWKGITPLHSSRTDVERILGVKSAGEGVDEFKVDMDTVQIRYTTKPCQPGEGGKWNVTVGTVTSIWVITHNEVLFDKLGLDLRNFKRSSTDVANNIIYTDDKNGIVFEINEWNNKVLAFYYYEREKDRQMRCSVK